MKNFLDWNLYSTRPEKAYSKSYQVPIFDESMKGPHLLANLLVQPTNLYMATLNEFILWSVH